MVGKSSKLGIVFATSDQGESKSGCYLAAYKYTPSAEQHLLRRHSVDSADWCGWAFSAGRVLARVETIFVHEQGLRLGARPEGASLGEVTLAEATVSKVRVPGSNSRPRQRPKPVIADRGHDSDPLRLWQCGIDLIALYGASN
jgi:hypothetical protein